MSELPPCPACSSIYSYADGKQLICPECGHEWRVDDVSEPEAAVVRDAHGNPLAEGDAVVIGQERPAA